MFKDFTMNIGKHLFFHYTFHNTGKREIGLKSSGLLILSVFGIGTTRAVFQADGNMEVVNTESIKFQIKCEIYG